MSVNHKDPIHASESESHASVKWYILAATNNKTRENVVADTNMIRTSRLWKCSAYLLFEAVLGSKDKHAVFFQKKINVL